MKHTKGTRPPGHLSPRASRRAAIWGPPLWRKLHSTAATGRLDEYSLRKIIQRIPCPVCKAHALQFLAAHPLGEPFQWTLDLHNAVNRRNNKPEWREL